MELKASSAISFISVWNSALYLQIIHLLVLIFSFHGFILPLCVFPSLCYETVDSIIVLTRGADQLKPSSLIHVL